MTMTTAKQGEMTFKIAGAFFWVSALFELGAVTASMPLFGVIVTVPNVILYHVFYILIFIALGFGLWFAKRWGYYLLWVTVLIYVADRVQSAVYEAALHEYIAMQFKQYPMLLAVLQIDWQLFVESGMLDYIVFMMQVMALTMAACWFGFGVYAYMRRAYFGLSVEHD